MQTVNSPARPCNIALALSKPYGVSLIIFILVTSSSLFGQCPSDGLIIGIVYDDVIYTENDAVISICSGELGKLKAAITTAPFISVGDTLGCGEELNDDLRPVWSISSFNIAESNCYDIVEGANTYKLDFVCSSGAIAASLKVSFNAVPEPIPILQNCSDGMIDLSLENANDFSNSSVTWLENDGVTVVDPPRVNVPEPGQVATYFIMVDDCSEFGEITINGDELNTNFTVTPSNPSACAGEEVTLTATSGNQHLSYLWRRGNVTVSSSDNYLAAQGDYTITASAMGCFSEQTITVTESSKPNQPELVASPPDSLCTNETNSLTISTTVGLTFLWLKNGMEVGTQASYEAGPGSYVITSSNGSCESEALTFTIAERDTHTPRADFMNGPYCEGDTLLVNAAFFTNGTEVSWSTGEQGQNILLTSGGDYSVTYTGDGRCAASFDFTVPVFDSNPVLPVQDPVTINDGVPASINVDLGMQGAVGILPTVEVEGLINATIGVPFVSGNNTIELEATSSGASERATGAARLRVFPISEFQCIGDPQDVFVNIVPAVDAPFIPEIISPNGDGSNDEWAVIFPENAADYDVVVYSRGGAVVFEGSGNQMPWDAGLCPNGVYYYQISERGAAGNRWQGAITIIGRTD